MNSNAAPKLLKVQVQLHKNWPLNSVKALLANDIEGLTSFPDGPEIVLIGLGGLNKEVVWRKNSSKSE